MNTVYLLHVGELSPHILYASNSVVVLGLHTIIFLHPLISHKFV